MKPNHWGLFKKCVLMWIKDGIEQNLRLSNNLLNIFSKKIRWFYHDTKRYVMYNSISKTLCLQEVRIWWICRCSTKLIRWSLKLVFFYHLFVNLNVKVFQMLTPWKITQGTCKKKLKCHFVQLNICTIMCRGGWQLEFHFWCDGENFRVMMS